jgi:hypothetical protein
MTITKRIHNTETGEVVDIELTDAEIQQLQQDDELQAAKRAAELAKKNAAVAKLSALGLEVDDLKALGL